MKKQPLKKCPTAKITILPKGPYEVCGTLPINQKKLIDDGEGGTEKREQGKDYPHEEITHLCRCGHSANKPFCDGTHVKIGFEGTEYATKEPYEQDAMFYQGGGVDLVDKEILCAAARFCHPGKGAWKSVKDSANPEDKERAMYQCTHCPSGRLTAVDKEGNAIEPSLEPEI
jgi:CDGSH-type Zn-finger protein